MPQPGATPRDQESPSPHPTSAPVPLTPPTPFDVLNPPTSPNEPPPQPPAQNDTISREETVSQWIEEARRNVEEAYREFEQLIQEFLTTTVAWTAIYQASQDARTQQRLEILADWVCMAAYLDSLGGEVQRAYQYFRVHNEVYRAALAYREASEAQPE